MIEMTHFLSVDGPDDSWLDGPVRGKGEPKTIVPAVVVLVTPRMNIYMETMKLSLDEYY